MANVIYVTYCNAEIFAYRGAIPWSSDKEGNPHWENFVNTMKFLSSIGFYVSEDRDIKKNYPRLSDNHKSGGFDNLRFKAEYSPNKFRISFYQDINYENANGGYYDFDKYQKMPYLIRKRFDWTLHKLIEYFESCGFIVEQEQEYKGSEFIIRDYIKSWYHPQHEPFDLSEIEGQTLDKYNSEDANGKILHNGEVKYFRNFNGYLYRGKVYHNINNMWWVLLPDGMVHNKASFELFDLNEDIYQMSP